MSKLRPSTALTVPILRLIRAPLVSGKCFRTSVSCKTGARSARGMRVEAGDGHWRGGEDTVHIHRPAQGFGLDAGGAVQSVAADGRQGGFAVQAGLRGQGQRGANEQPVGAWSRLGGMPSMGTSEDFSATSTRGTAPSRPIV